MFTGLIEDVGTIEGISETSAGREITIASAFDNLDDVITQQELKAITDSYKRVTTQVRTTG